MHSPAADVDKSMSEKITFAEMRAAGVAGGVLICLTLSSCSSVELPPVNYTPPSPPTQTAILDGVKAAAAERNLTGPWEISAARPADHGPGSYFICLRQADPTIDKRQPYSVFFDNDKYKGSRQSVIMDACETQVYSPVVEPPPPPAKSGRKRKP